MTSSALHCSIDELKLTTERAMRGVARTVSVHTGATSPHQDLIRALALHLLPVLEVLPAALAGRPHLPTLVLALTPECSSHLRDYRALLCHEDTPLGTKLLFRFNVSSWHMKARPMREQHCA